MAIHLCINGPHSHKNSLNLSLGSFPSFSSFFSVLLQQGILLLLHLFSLGL
jgi:hypothetical protein